MSREEIAPTVQKLRDDGLTWAQIGRKLGIRGEVAKRSVDADYHARIRERQKNYHRERRQTFKVPQKNHFVRKDDIDPRVLNSVPPDTRTFTARAFGDPLPGRSALDRKMQGERA